MKRLFLITAATLLASGHATAAPSLRQICEADYRKVCSTVMPGNGRGRACLAQNRERLSPKCKAAVDQEIKLGRVPRSRMRAGQ
jgi:hypothetical protein